ncbi:MAG TPA: ATP-binding protein [Polyangiaceae bacterium]|nr:ATP-binding protein [Polyangiaceae bacterium]
MTDLLNDQTALQQRIVQLEAKLAAKDRTIEALMRRVEDRLAERTSSFLVLEQSLALEHVVTNKTADLVDQKARLAKALDELRQTQAKLLQAQKLEAIGQLAAGIAHEVNTPSQYVTDNVTFLQRAFVKLGAVITAHAQVSDAARQSRDCGEALRGLDATLKSSKLDYLQQQIPRAIQQSLEGLGQVSSIVKAMKEFSHPSGGEKQPVDLHDVIESTTLVAKNEWKYVADLELSFDWTLPPVLVLRNELSQVFLNLIVNAAHAIAGNMPEGSTEKGKITISTRAAGDSVEIRVTDTGGGIPTAVQPHIFEPFFTTKEVGKGTGQGLAICYSVIVERHQGNIAFETEAGRGTTFVIRLPAPQEETATPAVEVSA